MFIIIVVDITSRLRHEDAILAKHDNADAVRAAGGNETKRNEWAGKGMLNGGGCDCEVWDWGRRRLGRGAWRR